MGRSPWTLSNSWFLGPVRPNPKRHLDRFSRSCTAYDTASPYMCRHFPSKLSLCMRGSGPPSNTWFFLSIQIHNSNRISIGLVVFAQLTAKCSYILQWAAHFPLKIASSQGWFGPSPSNAWFRGPTRVLNPNGISIGWAVFARLTSVTYVRSKAMRPNK